jgi:DNA-binding NtrC family response regulator
VESTLFGYERGAFTGADRRTKGVFEEADGGTVLLDEIGELPPPAQVALLRVLENKTLARVGTSKEIPVDVRIIAATHQDLDAMCEQGTFRRDLLFRLNTMSLELPPLRERGEEIAPLVERFIGHANRANNCRVSDIEREALELLQRYDWPGNVRELRNVIERAVILARSGRISLDELPRRLRQRSADSAAMPEEGSAGDYKSRVGRYEARLVLDALRRVEGDQRVAAQQLQLSPRALAHKIQRHRLDQPDRAAALDALPDDPCPVDESNLPLKRRVRRFEARLIRDALARAGGNKSEAARRLRIPLRTLTHKLSAYGIDPGRKSPE